MKKIVFTLSVFTDEFTCRIFNYWRLRRKPLCELWCVPPPVIWLCNNSEHSLRRRIETESSVWQFMAAGLDWATQYRGFGMGSAAHRMTNGYTFPVVLRFNRSQVMIRKMHQMSVSSKLTLVVSASSNAIYICRYYLHKVINISSKLSSNMAWKRRSVKSTTNSWAELMNASTFVSGRHEKERSDLNMMTVTALTATRAQFNNFNLEFFISRIRNNTLKFWM